MTKIKEALTATKNAIESMMCPMVIIIGVAVGIMLLLVIVAAIIERSKRINPGEKKEIVLWLATKAGAFANVGLAACMIVIIIATFGGIINLLLFLAYR